MQERPILSIVIVNWNTKFLLLEALESIYCALPPFPIEVIVVENASSDGSAQAVARQFPQAKLIENRENRGYAEGNNQGIKVVEGEWVLLLNPDVRLPEGGLEKAVSFLQSHPEAGAVGVKQISPNGSVQSSVRGFPTPASILWEMLGLSRLFPKSRIFGAYRMTWFDYAHLEEVDQPMTTFLMMRGEALRQVGLMDERFPIFFNDVDWCFRCKRAGWKIYFLPDVEIVHHGGAGTLQAGGAMAWASRRGLLDFYALYYSSPQWWPLRCAVAALSWPFAWVRARKQERLRLQKKTED